MAHSSFIARGTSPLRSAILVLLVLSAAGGLLVQPRVVAAVREGEGALWLVAVPATFGLVVIVAALDTWRTARRLGFFKGRSIILIAACVAFLGILAQSTFSEYRTRTSPPADGARLAVLSKHKDPRVRALVMNALGWRPGAPEDAAHLLAVGLEDNDPLVVDAALHAVARKAEEALAGDEGRARARALVIAWSTH